MKGPQFLVYVNPILATLKEMGGAGHAWEVKDKVPVLMNIPEHELEVLTNSGHSRVRNRIQWARLYLTKAGYIDSSQHGIWKLTEKGMNANLSEQEIELLFETVQRTFKANRANADKSKNIPITKINEDETIEEEHSGDLISLLQKLSASGFERICKRLLTECGFQQVEVTGRSGDNGIDGIGLLEINDLVTFKVLFQCKRYKESVGSGQVRDFRGAMQGRAEKGIILTTGYFTSEAKIEAKRDGVPPIELVDGDKLVELFEKYQLGLNPKTVFDIDYSFFEEFK